MAAANRRRKRAFHFHGAIGLRFPWETQHTSGTNVGANIGTRKGTRRDKGRQPAPRSEHETSITLAGDPATKNGPTPLTNNILLTNFVP